MAMRMYGMTMKHEIYDASNGIGWCGEVWYHRDHTINYTLESMEMLL